MLNLQRTAQAQALPPKDLLVLWDQDPAACAMLVRAAIGALPALGAPRAQA